jgi:serine/threonine protein phosphatase PrpC
VHTGDSRLYHFRGSKLVRRTKDHSYVQALVDQGELTEDEAAVHPKSNVLLGCLGTEDEPRLEAHYIPRLQTGDSLLACSDGLWHYFTVEELGSVLQSLSPREASQFLVEKARTRAMGGGDNLSLAIVKVEPPLADEPTVGSGFSPLR